MRGIALRSDFDAPELRAARGAKSGSQTRRLLALAAIYAEQVMGFKTEDTIMLVLVVNVLIWAWP